MEENNSMLTAEQYNELYCKAFGPAGRRGPPGGTSHAGAGGAPAGHGRVPSTRPERVRERKNMKIFPKNLEFFLYSGEEL